MQKSIKVWQIQLYQGVSEIINRYGAAIILEDDLIVSNDFLDYMQRGLAFYKNDERIWSIAGYSQPVPCLETYEYDVFLSLRAAVTYTHLRAPET